MSIKNRDEYLRQLVPSNGFSSRSHLYSRFNLKQEDKYKRDNNTHYNILNSLSFSGGKKNFETKFILSNVDIRSAGTAANTIGVAAVAATYDSTAVEQAPLAGLQSMTYTGSGTITMDATKCADIVYLCVSVLPVSSYTDTDTTNNYRCKSILNQLSCAIGKLNGDSRIANAHEIVFNIQTKNMATHKNVSISLLRKNYERQI